VTEPLPEPGTAPQPSSAPWPAAVSRPIGTPPAPAANDEIAALIRALPPHVILVMDEAYIEYLENPPDLRDLSLVAARCGVEGDEGFGLGVLGSTRMEYAHVVSLVDHVARAVSEILQGNRA